MHERPHNHSKNLRHVHLLPCVGPYKNTCNNSRPFLDIFSTPKVFLLGFFWFQSFWSSSASTYLQHPQNQNPTTLMSPYWKSSKVTCLYHSLAPTSNILLLISSLCFLKIPPTNIFREIWCIELLKHFHWTEEIMFHFIS